MSALAYSPLLYRSLPRWIKSSAATVAGGAGSGAAARAVTTVSTASSTVNARINLWDRVIVRPSVRSVGKANFKRLLQPAESHGGVSLARRGEAGLLQGLAAGGGHADARGFFLGDL